MERGTEVKGIFEGTMERRKNRDENTKRRKTEEKKTWRKETERGIHVKKNIQERRKERIKR